MKPTVGRIVHFYTKDVSKQSNGQGEGPYPAIVLQVGFSSGDYDTMSNLRVMTYDGDYVEGSVSEKSKAEKIGDTFRYWEWPPRD